MSKFNYISRLLCFVALCFLTVSCSSAGNSASQESAGTANQGTSTDASTGQNTIFEIVNPGIRAQFEASCESIDSKKMRCTTELPLGLEGGLVGYNFGRPPMNLFDFNRKDIRDLFSAGADLTYSITSGNPRLVLENIVFGNAQPIIFTGFQMDAADGRLNVRDPYLLSRNSSRYMHPDELEFVTSHHLSHPKRYQFACGKNTVCPVGTEYEINNYYFDYSFARTEDFDLSIRVSNKNLASEFVDINLIIKANRHAVSLKKNCPSIDDKPIEHWLCVRPGEIIPTPPVKLVTTSAMQNSLPDDLVLAKDRYELVANIEFNSLEEAKRYMDSNKIDDPTAVEVKGGKLIFHQRKVDRGDGTCYFGPESAAAISTHRRLEMGLGYFEIKFDEYPNLPAAGGNMIMWNRYGVGHTEFTRPPDRLMRWAVENKDGLPTSENSIRARRRLARIGFSEIDYIERWRPHTIETAFNVFGWPVHPELYLKDPDGKSIKYPLAHFYHQQRTSWPFVTNARTRTRKDNPEHYFTSTLGMELSPEGINIFKDGVPEFSTPALSSAFTGTAFTLYMHGMGTSFPHTVPHFTEGSVTIECDDVKENEPFVIDYIRFYKPINGYRAK